METDFKIAEIEIKYKNETPFKDRTLINSSASAYQMLLKIFSEDTIGYREEFKVVYLDHALHVVAWNTISMGGSTSTTVDIKMIIQGALLTNAESILLAHNHPSGYLKASTQDKMATENIVKAAKLFNIKVLDHLIVTNEDYYSFADNGEL